MSKIVKVNFNRNLETRKKAEKIMQTLESAGFQLFQVITVKENKTFLYKKVM